MQTITEIAQANQIHPVQVSAWKKELEERMHELFEKKGRATDSEQVLHARCSDMERLLGQKMLETEHLKKNARNWESNREENAGGTSSSGAVHSPSVRAVGGEPQPASPPNAPAP